MSLKRLTSETGNSEHQTGVVHVPPRSSRTRVASSNRTVSPSKSETSAAGEIIAKVSLIRSRYSQMCSSSATGWTACRTLHFPAQVICQIINQNERQVSKRVEIKTMYLDWYLNLYIQILWPSSKPYCCFISYEYKRDIIGKRGRYSLINPEIIEQLCTWIKHELLSSWLDGNMFSRVSHIRDCATGPVG